MSTSSRDRERGAVLIAVLAFLVVIALACGALSSLTASSLRGLSVLSASQRLADAADNAAQATIQAVRYDPAACSAAPTTVAVGGAVVVVACSGSGDDASDTRTATIEVCSPGDGTCVHRLLDVEVHITDGPGCSATSTTCGLALAVTKWVATAAPS